MAKIFCGSFLAADLSNTNFPDEMSIVVSARAYDDNGNQLRQNADGTGGYLDSVSTGFISRSSTATHINKALVDGAIEAVSGLTGGRVTVDSADVIFQPFDRG